MNDNEKSMWKGTIIFGLVNFGFVWICTKLNVMLLSSALILLIVCGIYVSFQGIKEDLENKRKGTALLGVLGFMINISAMIYYIVSILSNLLNTVFSIFSI